MIIEFVGLGVYCFHIHPYVHPSVMFSVHGVYNKHCKLTHFVFSISRQYIPKQKQILIDFGAIEEMSSGIIADMDSMSLSPKSTHSINGS